MPTIQEIRAELNERSRQQDELRQTAFQKMESFAFDDILGRLTPVIGGDNYDVGRCIEDSGIHSPLRDLIDDNPMYVTRITPRLKGFEIAKLLNDNPNLETHINNISSCVQAIPISKTSGNEAEYLLWHNVSDEIQMALTMIGCQSVDYRAYTNQY